MGECMSGLLRMETSIGWLGIEEQEGAIVRIHFDGDGAPVGMETWPIDTDNAVLLAAREQLAAYFAGTRTCFELPMAFIEGTAYQKKVWQALIDIPYGETRTYGDIAAVVGNPRAARAVGGANHANPIPIVVPCHRVIGKNGKLTGFGGGLDKKEALLALERR